MQLSYGGSLFPVNATAIGSSIQTVYNEGGQKKSEIRRLNVDGFYTVVDQGTAAIAESALRTTLSVPFRDLIFLNDAGIATPLQLLNAGSITGVRILNLTFPNTRGPEYATQRSFRFEAEAEYPVLVSSGMLLSFTETLSFDGGDPIYKHRLSLNGPPVKYLVYPQDTYRAVQHGSLLSYTDVSQAVAPAPIWPYALKQGAQFTRTSPTRKGLGFEGYGLTWTYQFEDAGPLIGFPTVWTF